MTPQIEHKEIKDDLFEIIKKQFSEVRRKSDYKILCANLAESAQTIAPIYDSVFGNGVVSKQLKKDIINSSSKVKSAILVDIDNCSTVDGLINYELKKNSIEKVRKDVNSGIRNILWMNRALRFIITFIRYVIIDKKDISAKDCAIKAYEEILKPYHGIMVSGIVTMAFKLCPSREHLCERLGFVENIDKIEERLKDILLLVNPILEDVQQQLIDSSCNFQDKV